MISTIDTRYSRHAGHQFIAIEEMPCRQIPTVSLQSQGVNVPKGHRQVGGWGGGVGLEGGNGGMGCRTTSEGMGNGNGHHTTNSTMSRTLYTIQLLIHTEWYGHAHVCH